MPEALDLPAGAVTLNEAESKAVLRAFGIPVAREVLVPAGADAAAATRTTERARSPSRSSRATSPTRPRPAASC